MALQHRPRATFLLGLRGPALRSTDYPSLASPSHLAAGSLVSALAPYAAGSPRRGYASQEVPDLNLRFRRPASVDYEAAEIRTKSPIRPFNSMPTKGWPTSPATSAELNASAEPVELPDKEIKRTRSSLRSASSWSSALLDLPKDVPRPWPARLTKVERSTAVNAPAKVARSTSKLSFPRMTAPSLSINIGGRAKHESTTALAATAASCSATEISLCASHRLCSGPLAFDSQHEQPSSHSGLDAPASTIVHASSPTVMPSQQHESPLACFSESHTSTNSAPLSAGDQQDSAVYFSRLPTNLPTADLESALRPHLPSGPYWLLREKRADSNGSQECFLPFALLFLPSIEAAEAVLTSIGDSKRLIVRGRPVQAKIASFASDASPATRCELRLPRWLGSTLRLDNIAASLTTADLDKALEPHLAGGQYWVKRGKDHEKNHAHLHLPSVEAAKAVLDSIGDSKQIVLDGQIISVDLATRTAVPVQPKLHIGRPPGSDVYLYNIPVRVSRGDLKRAIEAHLDCGPYRLDGLKKPHNGLPSKSACLHLPSIEAAEAFRESVGNSGRLLVGDHAVYIKKSASRRFGKQLGSRLCLTNISATVTTADLEAAFQPHLAGVPYRLYRNTYLDSGRPALVAFLHLPSAESAEAVKASIGNRDFVLVNQHPVYVSTAENYPSSGPRPTELQLSGLPSSFTTAELIAVARTAVSKPPRKPPVVRRGTYANGQSYPFAFVEVASQAEATRIKEKLVREPRLAQAGTVIVIKDCPS